MRVGVYADMAFRLDGGVPTARQPFVRFLSRLPPRLDEVVLFGRLDPVAGEAGYPLDDAGVRFVALPYYPRVTAVAAMAGALPRTCSAFARELPRLDAVVVFGPHPVALALAHVARRAGTPLVLGVRQDYPQYIRHRLPGRGWEWAVPAARALDLAFRALARRTPTIALGAELARRYSGGAPVLDASLSLLPEDELVELGSALARSWDGTLRLLSVGRLDPEKNPLLLVDVLAQLRRRAPRWRLTIAGDGPLRPQLATAVAARGLRDVVELVGTVPNGPELWALYRRSHAFLHVSLTEGLPQVLVEAQASGVPVVATAVGGVAAALGDGARGLLVAPGDARAAAAALERLAADAPMRARLVAAGLEHARGQALEPQLDRVARFVMQAAAPSYRGARSASPPAAPASAASSQR